MEQCIHCFLRCRLHVLRQCLKVLLFYDPKQLFFGNGGSLIKDVRTALSGADFLHCCFQVMEPAGIGQDIEHIHIHMHLADGLPDLLPFSRQDGIRIVRHIRTAPASLLKEPDPGFFIFAGNELLDGGRREQRHFQSTDSRDRIGILCFRH